MKLVNATAVGGVTLVSHLYEDGAGPLRIVNFNYENLSYLLDTHVLPWPIKVLQIGKRTAIVYDPRVPDEFFDAKWCTVCCPERLLPMPQRIHRRMSMKRKEITVKRLRNTDGSLLIMESRSVHSGTRLLKGRWTVETKPAEIIFADYMVTLADGTHSKHAEALAKQLSEWPAKNLS